MRATLGSVLTALIVTVAPAGAQTILGNKFQLLAKPGYPLSSKLVLKAQESLSPEQILGDPATNGAVLTILLNGGTPSTQVITLPAGTRWRGASQITSPGKAYWKYRESNLARVTPVKSLQYAISYSGKFKLQLSMDSRYFPITVGVPNPGTYAGMVLSIPGGDTYCVNFGGVAGGTFSRNDAYALKIGKPTAEGTCPSGTPVCGDGVVDGPFETCDTANDAACPGLCGAN